MKRIILSFLLICATFSAHSAQLKYDWSAGAKLALYTRWNETVAVGGFARYGLTDNLRIEPSLMILTKSGMSVDLSVDLHYGCSLTNKLELYPLVGLSLNDPGTFGLGLNLGGGVNFINLQQWEFGANIKWMVESQKHISNPVVLGISGNYKF